jgi:hypothetical protein
VGWSLSRRWLAGTATAVAAAVLIGVPTGIVHTPFYTRMTPVLWWNYPVWVVSALLEGAIVATYVRTPSSARLVRPSDGAKAISGGLFSLFAVGCPICNKLVVLAVGMSGAVSYFSPIQPFLAGGSVALLGYALYRRLRALRSCPVRPGAIA